MTLPVPKLSKWNSKDIEFAESVKELFDFDEITWVSANLLVKGDIVYVVLPCDYENSKMKIYTYDVTEVDKDRGRLNLKTAGHDSVITFSYDVLNMWHAEYGKNLARAFISYRSAFNYANLVESAYQTFHNDGSQDEWDRKFKKI